MELRLITRPSATFFDDWLADAKAYLRVDSFADDKLILDLIHTAVARLDGPRGRLGRALAVQTWRMTFNEFDNEIPIPLPPLQSVTSVSYTDTFGAPQTLASSAYTIAGDDPGFLTARTWWPATSRADPGIVVTFVAGVSDVADISPVLKTSILEYVSALYDARGGLQTMTPILSDMLDGLRTRAFG